MSAARAVLALSGTLLLAGCQGAASEAAPSPDADDRLTGTVTVFAAASLTESFEAIAEAFEGEHPGVEIVAQYGGSGALATQLLEAAPADVFATANETTMQLAADVVGVPTVFATNTLVIAVPAGNPAGVDGLADLADPGLRIALCDVVVPCGSAALAVLEAQGVVARPDTLEEDVTAVTTKVSLGEVDAALVYLTDARAAGEAVETIEVPGAEKIVNRYSIAVVEATPNPDAAEAFIDWVLSARGREVLSAAGFGTP